MNKKKEITCAYSKHELVFAKIRGYPWWPGVIGRISLKTHENGEKKFEVLVNFIGDDSHSIVYEDKLQKFTKKEVDLKNKKRKKLMESIAIANEIHDGLTSYEDWHKQNRKKVKDAKRAKAHGQSQSQHKSLVDDDSSSAESLNMSEEEEDDPEEEFEQEEEDDEQEGGDDEFEGTMEMEVPVHNDSKIAATSSNQRRVAGSTKANTKQTNQMKRGQKESSPQQKKESNNSSLKNKKRISGQTNQKPKEEPAKPRRQSVDEISNMYHFGMENIISNGSSTCPILLKNRSSNDESITRGDHSNSSYAPSGFHRKFTKESMQIINVTNENIVDQHANTVIETDDDEEEIGGGNVWTTVSNQESEQSKIEGNSTRRGSRRIQGQRAMKILNQKKKEDEENEEAISENDMTKMVSIAKKTITKRSKGKKIDQLANEKMHSHSNLSSPSLMSSPTPGTQQTNNAQLAQESLSLTGLLEQLFQQMSSATDTIGNLQRIIYRVKSNHPNPDNIMSILGSFNGKQMICARTLICESQAYQEQNASIVALVNELDGVIKLLQDSLLRKFFESDEQQLSQMRLLAHQSTLVDSPSPVSSRMQNKASKQMSSHLDNSPSENDKQHGESDPLRHLSEEQRIMRRKICLKIIKSLQRILNGQVAVQSLAKNIENMIRFSDPSMGTEYKVACRNFITLISQNDFTTSIIRIEEYIASGNPAHLHLLSGESHNKPQETDSAIVAEEDYDDSNHVKRYHDTGSGENTPVFKQACSSVIETKHIPSSTQSSSSSSTTSSTCGMSNEFLSSTTSSVSSSSS